jgi:trk system potassium uptake protein TrkH
VSQSSSGPSPGASGARAWLAPYYRRWFDRWSQVLRPGREARRRLLPVHVFVGSFFILIVTGTLGLKLLPGLYTSEPLDWLDALFTATSAVCVTGLIVVDTATYFTPFGQAFLLLLIQLGGLGMITFATVIILGLGGRPSLRTEALTAVAAEVAPHIDYRYLTRNVLRFTLTLEAAGAIALWAVWLPRLGGAEAIWPAVFHSVSAFCNAGFSTFSDSLISFRDSPLALAVVMMLVVLGGLGFLVLEELYVIRRSAADARFRRLSLHSRLAIAVTLVLLALGFALFALFEWRNTLAELSAPAKLVNALFMSVTPRTAGFNTVDYAEVTESSAFLTVILMFIGGSPGSTAGGVKTTTIALIALLAWSRLRGRGHTDAWSRTIPDETIQRAVGLFVVAFVIVTGAIFLLTMFSPLDASHAVSRVSFLARMFEAVSAFATVGLSMGLTGTLSPAGEGLTILLMYVGRVGPLAFAAAIALPERRAVHFRFAHENVIVG